MLYRGNSQRTYLYNLIDTPISYYLTNLNNKENPSLHFE